MGKFCLFSSVFSYWIGSKLSTKKIMGQSLYKPELSVKDERM